jgi:hypothetical protein
MGHYKTLLECCRRNEETLPNMIIDIAYIAPITGSPLNRWKKASQVMIEKGKGRLIDNLRIIQLVEADLNFVLHTIWGKRLIRCIKQGPILRSIQTNVINRYINRL